MNMSMVDTACFNRLLDNYGASKLVRVIVCRFFAAANGERAFLAPTQHFNRSKYEELLGSMLSQRRLDLLSLSTLPERDSADQTEEEYSGQHLGNVQPIERLCWFHTHLKDPIGCIEEAFEEAWLSLVVARALCRANPVLEDLSPREVCMSSQAAAVLEGILRNVFYGLAGRSTDLKDPVLALEIAMSYPPIAFDEKRVFLLAQ